MKDLQTVLDALELAERTSYSESNQDKFIESIAIVKQMMQEEPVAYEFRMRAESVVRWGMWSRCNKEQYEMYIRAPKLDDWVYETRALFAAPQAVPAICEWKKDPDYEMGDTYHSSCGELWSFIDGGPQENRVSYCHHCGKPVKLASALKVTV